MIFDQRKNTKKQLKIKKYMTNREKAIEQVREIDDKTIYHWQKLSHMSNTCQWVEVYPDGDIVVTEEATSNSTHWIDYPNEEVQVIYSICNENSCYCDCDACTLLNHYNNYIDGDMSKEEFEDIHGFEPEDIENDSFTKILRDYDMISDPDDIRSEMIQCIEDIYKGYFCDEE